MQSVVTYIRVILNSNGHPSEIAFYKLRGLHGNGGKPQGENESKKGFGQRDGVAFRLVGL
jgi:hypothetical protein